MKLILLVIFSTSLHSFAGIHTKNLWSQRDLKTCFAEAEEDERTLGGRTFRAASWKEKDKSQVKKWITSEFSEERTGIYFSGFQNCLEMPDADVVVFYKKNSKIMGVKNGFAHIGPTQNRIEGYPLAKAYISLSSSGINLSVATHEFGHSAGLVHEHLHPDAHAKQKGICLSTSKDPEIRENYVYQEFDQDSVMNYCKINGLFKEKVGLSRGDVALLKKLYP